jgi:glucose dehydrogenase
MLLTRKGGLYYVVFGLACAGVGGLLLRCKRSAIWVHAVCVAAALLWAWRGYAGNTFVTALIQSAPVWVPALWLAVPSVRDPLN